MKKRGIILLVIAVILLLLLAVKYFMCKNSRDKILASSRAISAQDLLNAAKPCKFFSLT